MQYKIYKSSNKKLTGRLNGLKVIEAFTKE